MLERQWRKARGMLPKGKEREDGRDKAIDIENLDGEEVRLGNIRRDEGRRFCSRKE